MAWPIMLANAAVPLLGLTDTAVLGNTGQVAELGAVALGALVFSMLYWSFGFLRMSTTGFTAQAAGAGDEPEVRAVLARALASGFALGWLLILLQWPLGTLAFWLLDASSTVEATALEYFELRIWGAPAALSAYALMGSFIGLGKSKQLLAAQLVLNLLNMALDVWFAGFLGWGARGIALGTAIAEWTTLGFALVLAYRVLRPRHVDKERFWPSQRIRSRAGLAKMLTSNADIMIRTLSLLMGFAWFTNQSARFGDTTLAANHILLQFLSFSAFFLDGYAFVAESLVGAALGARERGQFRLAVRLSTELSAFTALLLGAGIFWMGPSFVHALTNLTEVRDAAIRVLPWAALYVSLGFAAFQLDGIFIGTTRTREMRSAALAALAIFLGTSWPLTHWLGNQGLWLSFTVYVVARAMTLAAYYPRLLRALAQPTQSSQG